MPAATPPRKAAPARARARARRAEPESLLGDGFLAGVATSGYQIEGGFNGDGEPHNNWSGWEATGRVARSGLACDFWRQPAEALDRAAAIGCNAFRLSVEWARLEPRPGVFDDAALERYVEILALCAARGLEPMVTLHHFTHPWWLGEEFWLRPGSPDVFARHVARIVPALSAHCRRWVTVNEPNIVMLMGWIEGSHPPGRRMAVSDAFCVLDNLLTAHVLAADVVSAVQSGAEVTINTSSSSVYELDRMLLDLLQLREAEWSPATSIATWTSAGRSTTPPSPRTTPGRRPCAGSSPPCRPTAPSSSRVAAARGPACAASPGARRRGAWSPRRGRRNGPGASMRSASTGTTRWPATPCVSRAAARPPARRDWSFGRALWDVAPNPAGLRSWCATEAALRPGLPLWVVENGMSTRVRAGRPLPRDDGLDRPRYVREHLGAVADAVADGVPVRAYLHWSLVDNYEWGTYEPRFGLYGLDRSDPGAVRWMDTDAQGDDAAGEFARVLAGLRAGDRSVLDAPA